MYFKQVNSRHTGDPHHLNIMLEYPGPDPGDRQVLFRTLWPRDLMLVETRPRTGKRGYPDQGPLNVPWGASASST